MARLKVEGAPAFRLLVLGDGDERAALETMIVELNLQDTVHMAGDVPSVDAPAHLAIADIFVFASAAETQGMVVLEAMAAGLPVAAVNSSGIDAFVDNRRTEYATSENLVIWADTLHGLMVAGNERKAMRMAAREAAAKYSIEVFGTNCVDLRGRNRRERRVKLRRYLGGDQAKQIGPLRTFSPRTACGYRRN